MKGFFFVLVTALMLGLALDHYFAAIRRSGLLLQEAEERWRQALAGASQAAWDWNAQTHEVLYSPEWKAMLGFEPQEVDITLSEWESRVHAEDLPRVLSELNRHLDGRAPAYISEHRIRCKDGSFKWILTRGKVVSRASDGKPLRVLGTHSDITEQTRNRRLQALSAEVLRILNDRQALPDAIRRILDAIKRDTGIEAVGIRLKEDKDYPYAASEGFSASFLQAENSLAPRTREGGFCLDGEGNVSLECTCGLVLSGKTDASNALFTSGGSAWTSDAGSLPDLPAKQDPRLHPRNRCLHEGYQSVALIPIRVDNEIIGLLQLNDRRKGCFNLEMIRYYEGLASSFGVALQRLKEEQAVIESRNALRSLIDAIPESLLLMNLDGHILAANAGFAARFDKSIDECVGNNVFQLLPQPLVEVRRAWMTEVVRTRTLVVNEEPWGDRWLRHNYCPGFAVNGAVERIVVLAVDITEKKRAEAILHDQLELQNQLAKVAATVPGLIYSFKLRPDGSICVPFATPAIAELFGLQPEDVRDDFSPILALIHPEDRARLQESIRDSARTLEPWRDTIRSQHPRKGEIWVEGHSVPQREPDGGILWHGFVQDVTERKRAEAALRQSEQRFRHLVETTFDWIWEVDAEGHYTYASPKVRELLGYAPEEVIGRTPFDLMPVAEAERVAAVFRDIVARRVSFSSLENANLHKDGRQVVLETSGVPVFGDRGELLGYRGMDRDVTERKGLESQLRQAQKLEAIGQLAGGVAHDFNNILAAILLQLGLLRMSSSLDPETNQTLIDLETEARRAASLTRQLLMFSRRSVLDVKPLDLNEIVKNLLKMLGRLIGEQIRLLFDGYTGQLPAVNADAGMMEQVLMNLVVNARDAMPKGGCITISTRVETLDEQESHRHANFQPGCFVCLAVTDTGIGMNRTTIERIFEPFFTTKEPGKGTGLGLATVHGIVAQHKGWIEVESEVGQGASFRVFLPAVRELSAPVTKATPSEPPKGGREVILVVEDEAQVRRSVGQALRALGYRVYEAETGQQAMVLWQQYGADVDLLFTDMVMPEGMTGLELAERLQGMKPTLKVIVSSGYSSEIFQAGGIKQAGVWYLPKPYEARVLAETIRACFEGKH